MSKAKPYQHPNKNRRSSVARIQFMPMLLGEMPLGAMLLGAILLLVASATGQLNLIGPARASGRMIQEMQHNSPAAQPGAKAAEESLGIKGAVPHPRQLTAKDIEALPRKTVQIKGSDGKTVTYEGPSLADVLATAGVTLGSTLRGAAMANYLVVTGADGYRAVFALPELDAGFTDNLIILADRRDGQPLSATEGPLRIVVPSEKRQARSVRQVVALTIMVSPP
ncbi:MAG TPA: molybdopterin-dependent oxidoreductase [Blastocatellia bacterium]